MLGSIRRSTRGAYTLPWLNDCFCVWGLQHFIDSLRSVEVTWSRVVSNPDVWSAARTGKGPDLPRGQAPGDQRVADIGCNCDEDNGINP